MVRLAGNGIGGNRSSLAAIAHLPARRTALGKCAFPRELATCIRCSNDLCNSGNVVFSKEIPYTDFPLETIKLYFANNVIHFPSEY